MPRADGGEGATRVLADLAGARRGQRVDDLVDALLGYEGDDLVDRVGRVRPRAARGRVEAEHAGERVGDAGGGDVRVGVGGVQRRSRSGPARWTTRPLNEVAGTPCTAAQEQRVVGEEEVGVPGDRLVDDGLDRVDGEEHAPDGAAGSPQTSPTASQSRAHAGSYICSSTLTTWARVGVPVSLVTTDRR